MKWCWQVTCCLTRRGPKSRTSWARCKSISLRRRYGAAIPEAAEAPVTLAPTPVVFLAKAAQDVGDQPYRRLRH